MDLSTKPSTSKSKSNKKRKISARPVAPQRQLFVTASFGYGDRRVITVVKETFADSNTSNIQTEIANATHIISPGGVKIVAGMPSIENMKMEQIELLWRCRDEIHTILNNLKSHREEGYEVMFPLGNNVNAVISVFKGNVYVHVREYISSFELPNFETPTMRGVSIKSDEFRSFVRVLAEVREYLTVKRLPHDKIMEVLMTKELYELGKDEFHTMNVEESEDEEEEDQPPQSQQIPDLDTLKDAAIDKAETESDADTTNKSETEAEGDADAETDKNPETGEVETEEADTETVKREVQTVPMNQRYREFTVDHFNELVLRINQKNFWSKYEKAICDAKLPHPATEMTYRIALERSTDDMKEKLLTGDFQKEYDHLMSKKIIK